MRIASTGSCGKAVRYFSEFADACHNQKEEQHLVPRLAAAGIPSEGGFLTVMLMEHERSIQLLDAFCDLGRMVVAGDAAAAEEMLAVFVEYGALRTMRPSSMGILAIESELGVDTRSKYQALVHEITQGTLENLTSPLEKSVVAAILNALPVELSFVDVDDGVRYFNHENHAKIFPRTRGGIGMKARNCHPPKGLHMVEQILADFKAGRRELAEFWIDMAGERIHIRHVPVRGARGEYLGCLETVQDRN